MYTIFLKIIFIRTEMAYKGIDRDASNQLP